MSEGSELHDWVDDQTAAGRPAVLLIYDDEDEDEIGHVYLSNEPAFDCPALIAVDVPGEYSRPVGTHLEFLFQRHRAGHLLKAGRVRMGCSIRVDISVAEERWDAGAYGALGRHN